MINVGVAIYNAYSCLRAEFDFGLGLSADNRAQVRLIDADDAVGTRADTLLKHHLLLLEHLEGCLQTLVVMTAETFQQIARMATKEIQKDLDISLEASKLRQPGLVYQLLALAFLLGAADESLTRFYAMRLRFPHMMAGAELIKQTVYQTAAVFKQIRVGRITNLGITAGGIHLQRSAVFMTILVRIFPLGLAAVCLRLRINTNNSGTKTGFSVKQGRPNRYCI